MSTDMPGRVEVQVTPLFFRNSGLVASEIGRDTQNAEAGQVAHDSAQLVSSSL